MANAVIFPPVIGLIWAGLSLGGSLIAAPAKFRAASLDLSTALDVGRAQFAWLGYAEWVLLTSLIGAIFLSHLHLNWRLYLMPIGLFLVQQIGLMPRLDAATLARINGDAVSNGYLHVLYIGLEVAKFIAFITIPLITLNTITESVT